MEGPDDLAATVRRLEARVQSLENLYGLIDLLALPGLLAGGAARIFDSTQAADSIPGQAPGFYGKEVDGRGLALRWTRFPEPGVLDIAVLVGMRFQLRLRVLHTPHINGPGDLAVSTADGDPLVFEEMDAPDQGVLEFSTRINPTQTGLIRLHLSSRAPLTTSSADTRKLGLPFVQLRSTPCLQIPAAD